MILYFDNVYVNTNNTQCCLAHLKILYTRYQDVSILLQLFFPSIFCFIHTDNH